MTKSKKKFNITVGADPEFFVQEEASGHVVPACGKFGGTKKAPVLICEEGGYLEDGATVEINVVPSDSLKQVALKIDKVLEVFEAKFPNYVIAPGTSAQFPKTVLKMNPATMVIGCSADKFVYGLRTAPQINRFKTSRFAGGHIHVGIDPWPEGLARETFVTVLDFLVLNPWCKRMDTTRYPFYGHPGLYRDTDYGVEWRSPDNWWCHHAQPKSDGTHFINLFDNTLTLVSALLEKSSDGRVLAEIVNTWMSDYSIRKLTSSNKFKASFGAFHSL